MRMLEVSLVKLLRRPATRIVLLTVLVIVALVYIGTGTSARSAPEAAAEAGLQAMLSFPSAFGDLAKMLVLLAGLAAAAYAGSIAGSEWTWGVFQVAVARGASRAGYVLATMAAIGLLLLVGWIVVYGAGLASVALAAVIAGIDLGDPLAADALGRLPAIVVGGWWAVVMQASIGFGVAFVTRSSVAGIVAVVGLMLAEQFAAMLIPTDILKLAPLAAAGQVVGSAASSGFSADLIGPTALVTGYLAVATGAAALIARRTEVV
jgi:hypothetical protein